MRALVMGAILAAGMLGACETDEVDHVMVEPAWIDEGTSERYVVPSDDEADPCNFSQNPNCIDYFCTTSGGSRGKCSPRGANGCGCVAITEGEDQDDE
ncbi:MAG: hypothetical protein AAF602_21965 [Myxococcota bacterium]